MKRKRDDSSEGYNFLDTYADMVTLLLTFFVLLYSMSKIDAQKWRFLVTAFSGRNQAIAENDNKAGGIVDDDKSSIPIIDDDEDREVSEVLEFDDLYYYLNNYFKENDLESDVSLFKGDGYTFITFRNNVFFDGDSAVLRPKAKEILDFLADAVKNISDDIGEIRAYGHTARAGRADEPNYIEGDRTLSSLRAVNVIIHLQKKNIIDPKKMVSEGYGEARPIVPHDGTEATRIKNRRVEIYVSKSGKSNITLEKIYEEINKESK